MYFKYTSEFANKFINLESLLQVYFRVQRQIHKLERLLHGYFWVSKINTSMKVKYTSKVIKNYINLENLPPVYFWVWI